MILVFMHEVLLDNLVYLPVTIRKKDREIKEKTKGLEEEGEKKKKKKKDLRKKREEKKK